MRRYLAWGLVLPFVLWNFTFVLVPLLTVLMQSLYPMGEEYTLATHASLANFKVAFSPANLAVIGRSAVYAGTTTLCCLLLGYPLAYYIAVYGGRFRSQLLILVVLPFWTSYLIRTFSWITLLQSEGVLNNLLLKLHLIPEPLQLLNTPFSVILGLTYGFLPFATLPIYVSLESQDRSLVEAAHDLGATPQEAFWKVVFPLSLPGVISGSLITFVPAMGDFVSSDILGSPQTQMIGNLIQQQFLALFDWPMGSALSLVLMLLMVGSMALYVKLAGDDHARA
ncbi:ABC transporter permease [bacterium]|nr:ABC transporter permease [bacterium]